MKIKTSCIYYSYDPVKHRMEINFPAEFRALEEALEMTAKTPNETEYDVEIKPHKEKRSLDANAYYWVLLTKLAKKLNTSSQETHNLMLARYGVPEIVDGNLIRISIPESDQAEKMVKTSETYHLRATTQVLKGKDDRYYRTYIMMRGSSAYTSDEMAALINGLIEECKEIGIPEAEIATPDQRIELKARFNIEL